MRVVVLAAGYATRLYPLTRDRAKPLLDVGGRPVLSRLLDRVLALDGVREVVVVTNARFHDQFVAWLRGFRSPVPVRLIDDGSTDVDDRRGGVADMALAMETLPPADDVLVVAGDNLLDFDLAPHAAAFRARRRPLVLARRIAGEIPPRRYGEIEVDGDGRVIAFREKPEKPSSPLAATCIYFFPPEVRGLLRRYLDEGGEPDAPGHFIAWLARREAVYSRPFEGRCFDIGNLESLERVRAIYRDGSSGTSDTRRPSRADT